MITLIKFEMFPPPKWRSMGWKITYSSAKIGGETKTYYLTWLWFNLTIWVEAINDKK